MQRDPNIIYEPINPPKETVSKVVAVIIFILLFPIIALLWILATLIFKSFGRQ